MVWIKVSCFSCYHQWHFGIQTHNSRSLSNKPRINGIRFPISHYHLSLQNPAILRLKGQQYKITWSFSYKLLYHSILRFISFSFCSRILSLSMVNHSTCTVHVSMLPKSIQRASMQMFELYRIQSVHRTQTLWCYIHAYPAPLFPPYNACLLFSGRTSDCNR